MDHETEAARAAGRAHGIDAAELCASQVRARGAPDTDEVTLAILGCRIGRVARELDEGGMPDHLIRIWMDAAVKAGVARLQELLLILSQPKLSEH